MIRSIRPRGSRAPALWLAIIVAAAWGTARADDLETLKASYKRVKTDVLQERRNKKDVITQKLEPLLAEISALQTDAALQFLLGELDSAPPDVAASIPAALLPTDKPAIVQRILTGFSRRPAPVRANVLKALGEGEGTLKPFEGLLHRIAAAEKDATVKRYLPKVFVGVMSLRAAQLMVSMATVVKAERVDERAQAELDFKENLVDALVESKEETVIAWLKGKALRNAASRPAKLEVLVLTAGRLQLEGQRAEIENAVGSSDPHTATAGVRALVLLGAGPSLKTITSGLDRGRARKDLRFRTAALDALGAVGGEAALAALSRYAAGKDPELRALSMGSLALMDSEEALSVLVKGLADENPNVRSTCLVGLSQKRSKSMVGPLIEALAEEKEERLRFDVLKILVGLSGHNFGLVVEDWRKWWQTAAANFELAPELEEESTGEVTGVRRATEKDVEVTAKYFGLEVTTSKKVAFLLDTSGSMQGQKIQTLKNELANVVEKLPADTQINLIAFNANYRAWKKRLHPLAGKGRAQALKFVRSLSANSSTNVFDTLEFALKDDRVDTIFLLSDGAPTAGRITDPDRILREVKKLNRLRAATINCIAFGTPSPFLESLAEQHRGAYRFVEN